MTSSKTLKKIVSVGAAMLLALGGNALPAEAQAYTVTYTNTYSSSTGTNPTSAQTASDGTITVPANPYTGTSSSFVFLGWNPTTGPFGFQANSNPVIYNSAAGSSTSVFTATSSTTLKAVWGIVPGGMAMRSATQIDFYSGVDLLDGADPLPSDFVVTVGGVPNPVTGYTAPANQYAPAKLTLTNAVAKDTQQVRITYTPTVGHRLLVNPTNGIIVAGVTNASVSTSDIPIPTVLSNLTSSGNSSTSRSFAFESTFNGSFRWVVKLATSAAPNSASDLASGTYGLGAVANSLSSGTVMTGNFNSFNASSLTASTDYIAYVAGTQSQASTTSNMLSLAFTTPAPPAAPTITGTANVGETLTASASGMWYYCLTSHPSGAVGNDCSPIMGMMGALSGISVPVPSASIGMNQVQLVGKYITVVANNLAATTMLIGPAGPATISGTATVGNTLTVTAGRNAMSGGWVLCTSAHTSALSDVPIDCTPFATAAHIAPANGVTLDIPAAVYLLMSTTATDPVGKYIAYADASFGATKMSATKLVTGAGATTSGDATDTPITEDKRPLPVWANNVVKSIPSLTKSLNTSGGHVALTEGDYADLKSVTVGGKAITFKLEANGNVTIPVPAGEAGKTADIVIVFAGGTMTVQDGIKYVAPTDMAKVIERPIAIAAGAKKLTEAIADQIRQAAFSNLNNTTIQCVAYAAKNTSASKAAAKLTAVQACGIAAKANPALKVSEISVIVNKAKAKKQAVGIKVYK